MIETIRKQRWRRFKFFVKRTLIRIKFLLKYKNYDFFDCVNIETATACNRRCSYCPNSIYDRGLIKNQKFLPIETYKKIIDELAEINYSGKICPCSYNEPLLDKRLFDLMKYTREKLPKCEIGVFTNGDYLTEEIKKKLIECGVDRILLSEHKDINYKYRLLNNRGGLVNPINVDYYPRCAYEDFQIVIDYDGNLILCCNDYLGQVKFGNIKKEKLLNVWNNPFYKKIRKELRKYEFNLPIWKKCVGLEK